nr:hypothetical protein [Tanacetum cinerariifolium]
MNCHLVEAFTKTPSVVYQNFLREFWCTVVATHPNTPADTSKALPLKEYKINFLVMNGKNPLTLDYKSFVKSTWLDYAKGTYVSHPSHDTVKAKLAKIVENPTLLDMTHILKTTFLMAWRIMFTFVVQVLGENYSSTEQVNLIQQLFAFCLITGTKKKKGKSHTVTQTLPQSQGPKALGLLPQKRKKPKSKKTPKRNIQLTGTGLPSTLDEGTRKSQPLLEGPLGDKDSRGNKPHADIEPINPTVDNPLGTGTEYHVDQTQSTRLRMNSLNKVMKRKYFFAGDDMEEDTQADEKQHQPSKTDTEEPPSHIKGVYVTIEDVAIKLKSDKDDKEPTREVLISTVRPLLTDPILKIPTPEVQPITTIISTSKPKPPIPQREGKAIATDEEAEKIRLDPKTIISAKACEKFKKASDAEHQVLKREHSQKAKRAMELKKKRFEQYIWTTSSRLRPKPITDFKIHPNTKPLVLTVYRANDKRNFQVHNPFKFVNFIVTELDELGPIIQKKKNAIVKDPMTSLGKIFERLKKIPEELEIQSALPASTPKQALFESSGRKRKHVELNLKSRWNDIHKVGVDSLVSYIVMALMIKTQ